MVCDVWFTCEGTGRLPRGMLVQWHGVIPNKFASCLSLASLVSFPSLWVSRLPNVCVAVHVCMCGVPASPCGWRCSKGRFCFTCLNHLSKFGNDLRMLLMKFFWISLSFAEEDAAAAEWRVSEFGAPALAARTDSCGWRPCSNG